MAEEQQVGAVQLGARLRDVSVGFNKPRECYGSGGTG